MLGFSARMAMFCLALCGAGAAQAKDTITLCFERQEVLPWRTLNGGGLNFELLNQVAARLDLAFDYQSMPWKRCLEQLGANEVGGAFAVSYNKDRLKLGQFPPGAPADAKARMHVDRYVLVRKKGSRLDWDGKVLRNAEGAIGIQLGYSVGEFLRGLNMQVDEGSQRASELAQKLIAGRLAGAAIGGGDAVSLMNGPLASQLEVLPIPLIEKPYFLLLSHALVASNPQLANRIWKTIEEVRTSAQYKKLQREAEGGNH
ncbi:MAG: transporter substrate-binding domain-containing protein [Pseudomonadota bacterium]